MIHPPAVFPVTPAHQSTGFRTWRIDALPACTSVPLVIMVSTVQPAQPAAQSTQPEFAHALILMCLISHHLGNVNHVLIPSIAGLARGREFV